MNIFLRSMLFCTAFTLAACSPLVVVDQAPNALFPGNGIYAWDTSAPHDKLAGEDNPRVNNDIVTSIVEQAINTGMHKRGYTQATNQRANWLIHYHIGLQHKQETIREPMFRPSLMSCYPNRRCYNDYYWGWYGPPEFYSRTYDYTEGSIMVDIHDATTRKLVWRGMVSDEVNPNRSIDREALQKSIDKMFLQLPAHSPLSQ